MLALGILLLVVCGIGYGYMVYQTRTLTLPGYNTTRFSLVALVALSIYTLTRT